MFLIHTLIISGFVPHKPFPMLDEDIKVKQERLSPPLPQYGMETANVQSI